MEKENRLMSLDALRGFDMLFIMGLSALVVAVCGMFPGTASDAIAQSMGHVDWNGLQHHDTIFPLFLFLAGVSFPYSLASQRKNGRTQRQIYLKIVRRGVMLILLGMVYNGLLQLDFENLRCASVLGRIGLAWAVAAALYVCFGLRTRIAIAVAILVGYGALSILVAAPDVPGGDPLTMEGCLVGYVDRLLLPGRLIYNDGCFDPEGLLSAVPAVVTAMLGIFTGELLRLPQEQMNGTKKTLLMLAGAAVLGAIAWGCNGFLPINKMLWSSTFVCAVGAYSLAMMALFYYIIDVKECRSWTMPLRVVGMNSISIYLAQEIINFWGVSHFFFGGIAGWCSEGWSDVVLNLGYLLSCWGFLYFLYKQKVFLKV